MKYHFLHMFDTLFINFLKAYVANFPKHDIIRSSVQGVLKGIQKILKRKYFKSFCMESFIHVSRFVLLLMHL